MGVCNCSMFCCTLLYVHSRIAIILMGKRELIALLNLSSWCLVMVGRLFLAVPRGCLQFVIVVFPDHTHLLFLPFNCLYQNKGNYSSVKGSILTKLIGYRESIVLIICTKNLSNLTNRYREIWFRTDKKCGRNGRTDDAKTITPDFVGIKNGMQ